MSDFAPFALTVAIISEVASIAMLAWSFLVPDRRLWPPRRANWFSNLMAWLPTLIAFGGIIVVGVAEWNDLG